MSPFPKNAHFLFFVKNTSRTVFELSAHTYWNEKIGELSDAAYARFIEYSLIAPATIRQILDRGYKKDELRPLLKNRGLKVGGTKAELIERMIVADPDWGKAQVEDSRLYLRTSSGQRVADEIYDAIGREEGAMEMRLTLLIHEGRYEEAFRVWADWDEEEVFPRDEWQGIDNRETDPAYFVQMAQRIEKLLPVGKRERAILNLLYGRASYDQETLSAGHAAAYERDLLDWRAAPFIVGLRIEGPKNGTECSFSSLYEGCYRLADAPDYPFGLCDNEPCCVCFWSCIFDDKSQGIEWKIPARRHPKAGGHIEREPSPISEKDVRQLASILGEVGVAKISEAEIQVVVTQNVKPEHRYISPAPAPQSFWRRIYWTIVRVLGKEY
jgi:SAP domain